MFALPCLLILSHLYGSATLSGTLATAAKCSTAEILCAAKTCATNASSVISPSQKTVFGKSAHRLPVDKSSITTICYPASNNSKATCPPIYPAPPVINAICLSVERLNEVFINDNYTEYFAFLHFVIPAQAGIRGR